MATVNATNYAKSVASSPPTTLSANEWGGKLRVQTDSYTAASLAANDLINVANLPTNAVVVDATIFNAALGSGVTLDMGDTGVVDRYIDGAAGNTAGLKRLDEIGGFLYKITGTNDNVVKVKNLGAAATGAIETAMVYAAE